jgi:hypothetical protein
MLGPPASCARIGAPPKLIPHTINANITLQSRRPNDRPGLFPRNRDLPPLRVHPKAHESATRLPTSSTRDPPSPSPGRFSLAYSMPACSPSSEAPSLISTSSSAIAIHPLKFQIPGRRPAVDGQPGAGGPLDAETRDAYAGEG